MGCYSYKDVCYSVPEKYIENFKENHGREFDEDANYNGDYWIVVAEWIQDLENTIKELEEKQNV